MYYKVILRVVIENRYEKKGPQNCDPLCFFVRRVFYLITSILLLVRPFCLMVTK